MLSLSLLLSLSLPPLLSLSRTFFPLQTCDALSFLQNGAGMAEVQLPPAPTTCDCQPMVNGSILVLCTGDVKIGENNPLKFSQTFVLNPEGGSWVIGNTIFKLNYG